jgi:hypothetical protein
VQIDQFVLAFAIQQQFGAGAGGAGSYAQALDFRGMGKIPTQRTDQCGAE